MDSKEPQEKTYVLRKPINVEFLDDVPGGRYVTDLEIMGLHDYMWNEAQFDEEHFKAQFVPLDVSGLTRQVEESLTFLCQYAYDAGYTIGNDRTVTGKDVDLSVKATALEIVLLLNQEGETKK